MSRIRRRWYFVGIGLALLAGAGILLYRGILADLPDPTQPLARAGAASILITDRQGRTLYEMIDPQGSKYVPLPLSEIPLACQQATIATEDSRFYSHPGVDPLAILRAAWLNLTEGQTVSGASTLTQQVARTLYLTRDERNEQSLRRKLREAWLAWRIERRYNKNAILALYLNTTYYGHFAVGLEAASQAYFGTHARDLDLAQCALLAGIPQFPAGYNPIENPEASRARQGVVLGLMVRNGYIDAGRAREVAGERLAFAASPFPIAAPHFVMWAQSQLEMLLGGSASQAGASQTNPAQATDSTVVRPDLAPIQALSLAKGGLRVVTTLDLDWQRQAEDIVTRRLAQLRPCTDRAAAATGLCDPGAGPGRRADDAALVAMDPATGAVLAMVGSADYFDSSISGAVNAALSLRQPGSAIKPLTYAAAFDPDRARQGGQEPWTPATLIADVRTAFPTAEGQPFVPQNYDLRYHGPVSARAALANSYNIPAVKALDYIGVDALIQQARRAGIDWNGGWGVGEDAPTPTAPKAFGLALTLGGGEVRLLDLTAAYAAFANGGRRVTPFAIERVETLDGKVLLDCGAAHPGCVEPGAAPELHGITGRETVPSGQAIDPRVAYLVTDILADAQARMPAFGEGSVLEIDRPAAAKTGTTTDWRDNWTLGYTPGLAAGVWVGNADNTPMLDVSGVAGAGPIWHDFMASVLANTPSQEFPRPDGLVQIEVCADSGLLPGELAAGDFRRPTDGASAALTGGAASGNLRPQVVSCPNRRLEWFIRGTEPTEVDASHLAMPIDARSGGPAGPDTPAAAVRWETTWVMPASLREWARDNGMEYAGLGIGDWGSGTETIGTQSQARDSQAPLSISSPDPNRSYRLDPGLPASVQQIPLSAWPGPALAQAGQEPSITLLVDGRPIATVSGPDYTAWWPLAAGQHTVQATARGADGREVRSEEVVIYVN